MRLGEYYKGIEIIRENKTIVVKFLKPHMTISTCRASGGISNDYTCVYNHQACEPSGHHTALPKEAYKDPREYRKMVADSLGLEPEKCATLGTAANMHNACIVEKTYKDETVVVVATGGVESNAGRVGDPASSYEHDGIYEQLKAPKSPEHGTINVMIFINKELTKGALVRTLVTATEAKTSALQELCVNSRYSDGLATGTGTDQVLCSCMLNTGIPLSGAGKHVKLGELIGKAVKEAVMGTLALQNQLTPYRQCSAYIHLQRFGATKELIKKGVSKHLSSSDAEVFNNNYTEIDRDPITVAAVCALVHLKDKISWGVLPETTRPEIMASFASQVACSISEKYGNIEKYRKQLNLLPQEKTNKSFLNLVYKAIALGFAEKWDFKVKSPKK